MEQYEKGINNFNYFDCRGRDLSWLKIYNWRQGALLEDGVLTLEFDDPQNKTVGGACRVGILWFQIEATAKQFPEVRQVRFLPEDIFQP